LWGKFHGLTQNFFEIFQLPIQFNINEKKLDENYRLILKSIHPDRFVNATDTEKTQSLLKSTQINDAYKVLKNPIERIEYLLKINNISPNVTLDNNFLMQQMEMEEKLEGQSNIEQLSKFLNEITKNLNEKFQQVKRQLDDERNYAAVVSELAKIKFLAKLNQKIKDKSFSLMED